MTKHWCEAFSRFRKRTTCWRLSIRGRSGRCTCSVRASSLPSAWFWELWVWLSPCSFYCLSSGASQLAELRVFLRVLLCRAAARALHQQEQASCWKTGGEKMIYGIGLFYTVATGSNRFNLEYSTPFLIEAPMRPRIRFKDKQSWKMTPWSFKLSGEASRCLRVAVFRREQGSAQARETREAMTSQLNQNIHKLFVM